MLRAEAADNDDPPPEPNCELKVVADADFSGGNRKLGKRGTEHGLEQLQPAAGIDDEPQAELCGELGVELEADQRHRTCPSALSEEVGACRRGTWGP